MEMDALAFSLEVGLDIDDSEDVTAITSHQIKKRRAHRRKMSNVCKHELVFYLNINISNAHSSPSSHIAAGVCSVRETPSST